ncbi:uncharacterized protein [Paramormyrops kingsleyae]|uniref:uncharacterized protein isoform X2 n=1 Tax=Paramormyrops kingsleyae TaxID=1676925 RepID=UPI003B96FE16
MEAAMARVTVNKLVILVFMHHCHNPSHMTNITGQPCRRNIVRVVHCAFHETKGLLQCQENEQAVNAVRSALLSEERTELAAEESEFDGWVMLSESELSTAPSGGTSLSSVIQNLFLLMSKWNFIYPSKILSAVFPCLSAVVSWLYQNPSVKTHTLVAGETFKSHDTFMQKLNLQIERCSAESSSVILLFCPVVSRIGTDMEAAMARVTDNKPVILVFMHHCHKPSHMTNITVQPCRSNIVQVVHCAFHESTGLLECQENEQAVVEVYLKLLRYVDSQAEVPQSSTGSDIEQQLIAAQDDITHDSKVQSTEPMGERSESLQCKNVTEMEDSGGSCGGLAPEILQPNIDHSNMDMEEKPMAAQDGKRPQKRLSGENSVCPSSGVPTNPKKVNYASSLKVHVLVAGETSQAHETFIQKLKLQIERCSAESSSVILVFCPVVSQIKTDMEAAMARVTENKPVILMFMHRCHDSSHMTNITVQPSRSNIVQVVHCAFHETKGLLQCQENKQAVKAVRSALLRYK